jgi:hypothetical protein
MYHKDNIKDIEQNDSHIQFTFLGTSQEAAQLRNTIKDKLQTYCIHHVVYYRFKSIHRQEELASRLGLLVPYCIQQELTGTLNVKGPRWVTTNDIQGIPFEHKTPLTFLKENEEIDCQLIVKKGCGQMHQKWNPVSGITFKDLAFNQFQFSFDLIGLLTWEQMLEQLEQF